MASGMSACIATARSFTGIVDTTLAASTRSVGAVDTRRHRLHAIALALQAHDLRAAQDTPAGGLEALRRGSHSLAGAQLGIEEVLDQRRLFLRRAHARPGTSF